MEIAFLQKLLNAERLSGRKDAAEGKLQRMILKDHRWRMRLYRTLASRYRQQQSILLTLGRMISRGGSGSKRHHLHAMRTWVGLMERGGVGFATSLMGWVPPNEAMILEADETDKGLLKCVSLIDRHLKRNRHAKTAMIYPLYLVLGLLVMLGVLGRSVLPTLITIRTQSGQHVSGFLTFMSNWAWIVPVPLIIAYVLIKLSMASYDGPNRLWLDQHFFPWIFYRRNRAAEFMQSFASMWQSGVPIEKIFTMLKKHASPWLRVRLSAIAWFMDQGRGIGQAAQLAGYGFPDPEINDELADYEGDPLALSKLMEELATEMQTEVDDMVNRLTMLAGLGIMLFTVVAVLGVTLLLISSFDFSSIDGM